MLRRRRMLTGSTVLLAALLLPLPAWAQTASTEGAPARLRHAEGTVSVQRADANEAESAIVNLPIDAGDRLWTAEDGRAEILFEDGSTLWLDRRTTVDIVNLAGDTSGPTTIVRLWSGSAYLARPDHDGYGLSTFRVDAPAGSAVIGDPGLYRLDVDDARRLWLSTYEGYAELVAGGAREGVAAGRQSYAGVDTAPARPVSFNTAEEDGFAAWRADRYAALYEVEHYTTTRTYVPRSIVHHTVELYGHGSWNYYPSYSTWGWRPRVSVGWSPYRHGRWVHTRRGWCWVPRHSWGYVTAHYGRWHFEAGRWTWFPGHRFSPAWVQWYVGAGHVGWVPLNYFNRPAVSFNVFIQNVHVDRFDRRGHDGLRVRAGAKGLHVGADGSARGGRVVNGLGYSDGVDSAWTFVPSDRLGADSVERVAVARTEAAAQLQAGSKALISGPLKPRQPGTAVPRRAVPTRPGAGDAASKPTPDVTPRTATPRGGYRSGSGTVTRPGASGVGTGGSATPGQAAPRGREVEAVQTPRGPVARPGGGVGTGPDSVGPAATRRAIPRGVEAPSRGDTRPVSPLTRRAITPRRAPDAGTGSPRSPASPGIRNAVPRTEPRSPQSPRPPASPGIRNAAPRTEPLSPQSPRVRDVDGAIRRALPRSDRPDVRSRAVFPGAARAPIGQGDSGRVATPRRPAVRVPGGNNRSSTVRPPTVRVRPRTGGTSGARALPRSGGASRVSPPRVSIPRAPRVVTPRSSSSRSRAPARTARPRGGSSAKPGGATSRPKAKAKPKGGSGGSGSGS